MMDLSDLKFDAQGLIPAIVVTSGDRGEFQNDGDVLRDQCFPVSKPPARRHDRKGYNVHNHVIGRPRLR